MSFTLYAQESDSSTKALRTVARYAGVYLNVVEEQTDVAPVPTGPVLVTDQAALFQTNAIARFLASQSTDAPLYGETEFEAALIDGWLDWTREHLEIPSRVLLPVEAMLQNDYYLVKDTSEQVLEDLKVLNQRVTENTWLVGRHLSVADIVVVFTIAPLFTELFGRNHVKPFNSLFRWIRTVIEQPGVVPYFGTEFNLLKNSPIPNNPPKKAKDDASNARADDIAPDVSYLSSVETTLNLEEWKTKYANTQPSKPEATDWFWANYDPEGYCMFIFHYKFFDECTVQFKTNNLFGGFIQRADGIKALSRNSCASMCVLEKDERFHIWGVWIFKGNELPRPFEENIDDVNYYDWTPVDLSNEEHRALVTDFWAWESDNDFGGRGTFVGGKTYGV